MAQTSRLVRSADRGADFAATESTDFCVRSARETRVSGYNLTPVKKRLKESVSIRPAEFLKTRIEEKSAVIGIVGMGYVGLPLGLAFSDQGFRVLGFDTDPSKVEQLNKGSSYFRHLSEDSVRRGIEKGLLSATSDFSKLQEADCIIICVPTPLTAQREPDMTFVISTAERIAQVLRPGQMIILESTTYPGTTEELVQGILAESGLVVGTDYFLGFSPEREDPGNVHFSTRSIPKIVSGIDEVSGDLCEQLYRKVVGATVRVSTTGTAEATKLTENIFRAVNIALVNELKIVFDRMGIDIWEVLDAAETKPFGFMRFNPGPGWGGHCIPLDPFYLSWKAREYKVTARFIELAGEVNIRVPEYVVEKIVSSLNVAGKSVKGSRILLLGLAYKKDIDDPRESPAFEIMDLLLKRGAEVSYHDPYIPKTPAMRTWPELPELVSVELTPEALQDADLVVIVTDHSKIDYEQVLQHASAVVDTRGVFRGRHPKVVKA